MAENVIKRIYKAITNKSHVYTLQGGQESAFGLLGSVFNYLTGKRNFNQYTQAYGDNPLVYMIINKISFTSASIKRQYFDNSGDEIENSEIEQLLSNPNPDQGQIEFLQEVCEYLETTGNVFIRFVKGIGMGQELRILVTQNVDIVCNKLDEVTGYTYSRIDGSTISIPKEEILHIKNPNIVNIDIENYKFGLSPLQAGWIVVKSSSEKFNADASIFKNRGIVGLLTNDTDVPMLKGEQEQLQHQFNKEIGGSEKYNTIKVSNTKLRYVQTGMSPTDLKLLEGIVSSLRLLCSLYGMPSILFNDNERSTFNNFEQAIKIAYNDVYIPLANKIDNELSSFLSDHLGVEENIKVDLTSIEVIKASTNELAQALNSLSPLVANRVLEQLTIDEIREIVDAGKVEGGDRIAGESTQQTSATVTA